MQKIDPCLWFDHQAEEAVKLYTSLFQNSKIEALSYYGENMPLPAGTVLTVSFSLAGLNFLALNGGPEYQFTPAVSFFVLCQSEAEIDRLWNQLCEGGTVLMELDQYPFSEKFGWLNDRYGVSWQLNLTQSPEKIAPFLLFVGEQHGKAEQAIQFYTSIFPNSSVNRIQRFGPGMGETEGTVMHASFKLAGQEFMAMDSGQAHHFTFTPATSFYVHCKDQAEVDEYWEKLTAGGQEVQCGWLVDKYGLSWQIVPDILPKLMNDPDPAKAKRVTQAMLKMVKIDIGELERAYAG
jgi:predicted 3-demethylubiquinone-9 3-methyltransferase (glyoxalase superfamily)